MVFWIYKISKIYILCRSPGGTGDSRAFYGTALRAFTPYHPLYWFHTQAVTRTAETKERTNTLET